MALLHIAKHPGASNREIAVGAGIGDAGQMSKLLRRLADLGLAVNHINGQNRGGCNAWHLTVDGKRAARAAERATKSIRATGKKPSSA
jgi:hypothetical protein